MSEDDGKLRLFAQLADGLRRQPAYLLSFSLVLVLSLSSAYFLSGPAWTSGVIIAGSLVLGGFAIWLVERRTIVAKSPEQAKRLAQLTELEAAIQGVFEGLAGDETPLYFVYSSTAVDGFRDRQGQPIPHDFRTEERFVTTIRDASGIAKIHSLLQLGGKTKNIHVLTSEQLREDDWESNLILTGSPNSNPSTGHALAAYSSPLRFSDDMKAIEESLALPNSAHMSGRRRRKLSRLEPEGTDETTLRWPSDAEAGNEELDYAMIVKIKVSRGATESVCLVLAGIGPTGTLGACHYLERNLIEIYRRVKSSPFAFVISVVRDHYIDVKEIMWYELVVRGEWTRSGPEAKASI